jgi:hypothetical protein
LRSAPPDVWAPSSAAAPSPRALTSIAAAVLSPLRSRHTAPPP